MSVNSESDWKSGGEEEETSVKALLSNMTTMMAALNTCMDEMEGGWKKVAFHRDFRWMPAPAPELTAPLVFQPHPPVRGDWRWPQWQACPYACPVQPP